MLNLSSHHCVPCEGGTAPLTRTEADTYLAAVSGWAYVGGIEKSITRDFEFADFKSAVVFVNKIAEIAESEQHHPDISLHDYKKVTITLTTHAIGGLSVNDFVIASKINQIISS
jgi:4a-hydroxytetrahydrobiopterin dehydratase